MCRGFQQSDQRDRLLKIKAFYLSLSLSKSNAPKPLPDSLTLHYLPRINGGPLEINDSIFRPDSSAFLTLYRVVSDDGSGKRSVTYGSREKVRVSEGVRFEVYLREEKLVKGGFRKDDEGEWKMECKCWLEVEVEVEVEVKDVEVCVAAEGGEVAVMKETVEMVVRRKKGRCFKGLEEIPEQRREGEEVYCCCCCDCGGDEVAEDGGEVEVEVEGVRWAVDVGIWVVCLGVGYFVSKASMRRRRLL